MDNNEIEQIDLSPLEGHSGLETLTLHENPISELDVTPLLSCKSLEILEVDDNLRLSAEPFDSAPPGLQGLLKRIVTKKRQ